ncbi:MAG: hypothetical protein R3B53_01535 [Candidatus Paceibacterota bacterium]
MSPELIIAIKERIEAGHSKEQIKAEVLEIGYTEPVFEEAYQTALADSPNDVIVRSSPSSGTELISYGDFMRATWELAREQFAVFLKLCGINLLIVIVTVGALFVIFSQEILVKMTRGEEEFLAWLTLIGVVWAFIWLMSSFILIRALLKRNESMTLLSHFNWSIRHAIGLIVTSVVMVVLIMFGYVLLVVPGLMLVAYLYFTLFFYLDDRAYGVNSLVISTKYTYGRFWAVVGRIMLLSIVLYVITLAGTMLSMFTLILAPVFVVVVMLISYYLTYCGYVVLYESLLKSGVAKDLPMADTTLYVSYKWITIVITLLISGIVFLGLASSFY